MGLAFRRFRSESEADEPGAFIHLGWRYADCAAEGECLSLGGDPSAGVRLMEPAGCRRQIIGGDKTLQIEFGNFEGDSLRPDFGHDGRP